MDSVVPIKFHAFSVRFRHLESGNVYPLPGWHTPSKAIHFSQLPSLVLPSYSFFLCSVSIRSLFIWKTALFAESAVLIFFWLTVYTCNACWFYARCMFLATCRKLFESSVVLINLNLNLSYFQTVHFCNARHMHRWIICSSASSAAHLPPERFFTGSCVTIMPI